MKALSSRFSGLFRLYRKDDSAPTTIEWILLLVVALIVMVIIYTVVMWVSKDAGDQKGKMEGKRNDAVKAADEAFK